MKWLGGASYLADETVLGREVKCAEIQRIE